MGFIRVKKIKEKEYGYLVKNEWTNLGSRQRVKKYLGRVYRPDKINEKHKDIIDTGFKEAVKTLIKQELKNHDFNECLCKGDFKVNLNENTVFCKNKNAVIAMNEGFLCEETLNNLFSFKAKGYEDEVGLKLATLLVGLGLKIPEEIFINLFNKIYKGEEDLKGENEDNCQSS